MKKVILLIATIIGWYGLSEVMNPLFIPSPIKVLNDAYILLMDGTLIKAVLYSFGRITAATCLAACVAIPLGVLVFNSKLANELITPVTGLMRFLPITAFYPLLIMWFGIEETMKIAFLFFATFVYMLPSVVLALKDVDQNLIDTSLTMGMNKFQLNRYVILPATLPSILQTFVMMYGIGWTYIAVAETINAKYGLGYIIQTSSARGRTDMVFMAIIMIILVSIVFDFVANKIIKKSFKWRFEK